MDSAEYFERVIRFLETKGWNTSRTQVNESIYLVTGTRKSETYYDRMLAMVAIEEGATLETRHVEYLRDAASEHDVDQLVMTCRGGIADDASELLTEQGIEFIDPETIDDAFIDEFSIEEESSIFESARERPTALGSVGGVRFRLSAGYLLALYLFVAILFGVIVLLVGGLTDGDTVTATVVPGTVLLVGPMVAIVATLALAIGDISSISVGGLFVGTAIGYLTLVLLVGASGAAVGVTGSTSLFNTVPSLGAVVALSVPVAGLSVAVAYFHDAFRRRYDGSEES